MSAFVVEDETINRVVAYLLNLAWGRDDGWIPDLTCRAGFDLSDPDNAERLAQAMFDLNVAAVDARYGEGEAAQFRPLDFAYQPVTPPSLIGAYKALQCWAYQCSEGDVPDSPLYQTMDAIRDTMARRYIEAAPAYEAAPWA